jgi:hypothetical protein
MAHKFAGLTIREILRAKKGSVRAAPLPVGTPSWNDLENWTWEQLEDGARSNLPGLKTVRKLLSDQRFDR